MQDQFTLKSTVLPATTRVASFRGVETLSAPYEIEVNVLVPNEESLELAEVLGDRITLRIRPELGYVLHGVVASFSLLAEGASYGLFRLTMVPKLWHLTLGEHSRVFVGDTLREIIEKVFKQNGLTTKDYLFRVNGQFKKLDHVCQYHESDFAFISRWLEREGLYYFFEHDEGEDRERLVITDDRSFHGALSQKPVRYFPQSGGDVSAGASLEQFTCRMTTLPRRVALKDYDYIKPSLDVSGVAGVSPRGAGEVHVYGEGFVTPTEGARLAKIRSEELLAKQSIFEGSGRLYALRAGYTFALEEHPRAGFNAEYLVVALHHHGNQSALSSAWKGYLGLEFEEPYRVKVEAISKGVQFRAPRLTQLPRIYGTEEAVIDAADGHPYAEIDDHGRYKVKFKFDESDLETGEASMWIRMLQPHGGDVEGFHFPLRKGTEVLVSFVGGDPDRPVIAGVAHNAHNPSAVRSLNATRNVIQTGGSNRMEFEDTEGTQWLKHSTPPKDTLLFLGATGEESHNFVLKSGAGTGLIHTGDDFDKVVKGAMTVDVTKSVSETYHATKATMITGPVTETYHATVAQMYAAHHDMTVASGGRSEKVSGGYDQTVDGGMKQEITGSLKQKIAPSMTTEVEGPVKLEAASVDWGIKGDVKIECASWKVEQKGEVSWSNIGNFKGVHWANKLECTMGSQSGVFLGLKSDLTVGAKVDVFAGVKFGVTIAAQMDVSVGPKLSIEAVRARKIELDAKEVVVDVRTAAGVTVTSSPVSLDRHGVEVHTNGLTLFM